MALLNWLSLILFTVNYTSITVDLIESIKLSAVLTDKISLNKKSRPLNVQFQFQQIC